MRPTKSKSWKLWLGAALAIGLIGIGAASSATAQEVDKASAGFLYTLCQDNTQDSPKSNACHAYIFGVIQTLRNVNDPQPLVRYCLPQNVSTEQVRVDFNKWSQQHPKAMSLPGPYALSRALADEYGCK